jgi:fatty-acyl-CoA synthase
VPDEKYGEELLACVKLKEGATRPSDDEFRAMCKGKIAHFKIPRYWMVVDEFPMTVTGKIQKFKIRERAIHEFKLEGETVHTS